MLAENRNPGAALLSAGTVSRGTGYEASSMLMRSDFRNLTSWALMLNSGSPVFLRVPTSSGAAVSSSCLLKPIVASSTRKTSNPSSLILAMACAICSDSESDPLMASPSSFISCFKRVFTAISSGLLYWMPLRLPAFYSLSSIRQFSGYNKQNAGNFHYQKFAANRCKERPAFEGCVRRRQVPGRFLRSRLLCPVVADNRPDVRVFHPRRRGLSHSPV